MTKNLTYNDSGLAMTERFEGLRLTSYPDIAGNWTIGYGHKGPGVKAGQTITQAQATALLEADLRSAELVVNRVISIPLNQNEFDGLVDLAFNIGIGAFASSELVKYLNEGNVASAEAQFPEWCHAGGKAVAALLNRRKAELALFEQPIPPASPAVATVATSGASGAA